MSGLRNLVNNLRALKNDILTSRETVAVQIASNLLAQVENRIIQKGEDADGVKFPGYSTTPVPKFWFYGTGRTRTFDDKVKKFPGNTLSYKQARVLDNLQVDRVDFFRTGEMWQHTGVEITKRLFAFTQVSIKGKTKEARDKIGWNSDRYGTYVLKPQKGEVEKERRAYQIDRINRIKKFLR